MIDLPKMKADAEAATGGIAGVEWHRMPSISRIGCQDIFAGSVGIVHGFTAAPCIEEAQHIVNMQPKRALELIERVEKLEATLREFAGVFRSGTEWETRYPEDIYQKARKALEFGKDADQQGS